MAKMNMIRVLLLLTTNFDQYLEKFDVKNAFFHYNLENEIYMDIPLGFKGNLRGNKGYRLKKDTTWSKAITKGLVQMIFQSNAYY